MSDRLEAKVFMPYNWLESSFWPNMKPIMFSEEMRHSKMSSFILLKKNQEIIDWQKIKCSHSATGYSLTL